ncbi:hypothetical protein E2F50_20315 [Rhizobium deserti]|uniref:Uncharacterized protein n=1 Tax=Rhizobium deserti TaxID=2547961 RepID=A0A4V3ANK1_9HYPH|nr:hypothetical protein [Rhizobium deserti]TDK31288.1 hypothetical protein E2F50_20315 [Rhizobium deserti]
MPTSTTPAAKAADVLVNSGIMARADKAAMALIAELRAKLAKPRVLSHPSILFTSSVHILGEHDELRRVAPSAAYELAELEPWNGMSEAQIAELILGNVSDTYTMLMFIGITLGVRLELGDSRERVELTVEQVEQFVAALYDRTFGKPS